MKKLFFVLLALAVLTGGAFAQLTVAGYNKAKVTYNSDTKVGTYGDEIRYNLTGNDKDGNFGFSARFQGTSSGYIPKADLNQDGKIDSQDTIVDANGAPVNFGTMDFAVVYSYGWAKFFNGAVKLSMGKINEGGYQFGQNEANSIQGNVSSEVSADFKDIRTKSMEVTLAPMAGFAFSMIYTPNDTITGTDFKYLASYSVEKLLNIKVAATGNAEKKILATSGVEYVGTENLDAVVGLKMENDGDAFYGIYSIVGYKMDKLFIEGAGQYNTAGKTALKGYYVEGNVEYTDTGYSVRGFGQYQKDNDLAGDGNKYLVGAEVSFPVGTGELNAGLNYGDVTKASIPVYLTINF